MTQERTFDWRPNWSANNNRYMVSGLDCFNDGKAKPRIRYTKKVWLDQGVEGACTGFGTGHVLAAKPLDRPDIDEETARQIYHEARRLDEWPGEDYEGSSVNGAMEAARTQGLITEWRWCKTITEVKHALSYPGPLVIGVNWYDSMYEPDERGILRVSGNIIGGHCLMLGGFRLQPSDGVVYYNLDNSWGPEWGRNGSCLISEFDLERLLQEQGEFACPKKVSY